MSRGEGYLPTFSDKKWCSQGHVMLTTAPTCQTCQNAVAVIASDLLEQLHLGLLPALAPDPLIGRSHGICHDCGGPADTSICAGCLMQRGA